VETITVAEAIGRALSVAGAARAFGVVGSGNFHMTNALINAGVPFVQTRHELGGALAADAYARLSGRVALVSVHQGGGFLNAMTGVLEAVKAHTSIVVVAGAVARGDVVSNFHLDQARAFEAVGGLALRVEAARQAIPYAAMAVHQALILRRPVLLDVPVDVQEQRVEWDPASIPEVPKLLRAGASPSAVAAAVDAIVDARRVLVVVGRGARHAKTELQELARLSGALLVPSGAARGLFEGHEWGLDVMGGFATDGAAELMREADLLLVFGAALTKWTARGGFLTEGKRIIQVDDLAEAFGRHRPVELGILGDSAPAAAAIAAGLRERLPEPREGWRTAEVRSRLQQVRYWSDQPIVDRSTAEHVDPGVLSQHLDRLLPRERVVVVDGGNVNSYAGSFFRVPDENGYVLDIASQSIGSGLGEGLGAAIARPDRLTVVATGDGSLLMNAVELETAARLGLGMLILVYNDSAYGAEVHIFHDDQQKETVVFPDTDIAAIARGYGCEAIAVRTLGDLAPLQVWLDGPRTTPFLIDAKIEGFASPLMIQDMH